LHHHHHHDHQVGRLDHIGLQMDRRLQWYLGILKNITKVSI
jgi:hypothetical protein